MFNFHLGATRLIPTLIDSASRIPAIRALPGPYIVPKGKYRNAFRASPINHTPYQRDHTEYDADIRLIARWHDVVSISQQAFLGDHQDFSKRRLICARASSRVTELSHFLSDFSLTLHLVITHPLIYGSITKASDRTQFTRPENQIAWLPLVQAIHNAAPDRTLMVWDFQRPSDIAINFVCSMLGLAEHNLDREVRSALTRIIDSHVAPSIEDIGVTDVNELRQNYDLELAQMKRVPNVKVITSSAL